MIKSRTLAITILVIGVIALFTVRLSAYAVDEINYALVIQFGKIQQVRTIPGLHFRIPATGLVTEVDPSFQKLFHSYIRHNVITSNLRSSTSCCPTPQSHRTLLVVHYREWGESKEGY